MDHILGLASITEHRTNAAEQRRGVLAIDCCDRLAIPPPQGGEQFGCSERGGE